MAPTDTLKTTQAGAAESVDPNADLRARIFSLVYPETPLTREILDGLLQEALATGDPDVAAELIMTTLGRDALKAAREMADRAAAHFPENKRLSDIVALIAPPRVRLV